MIDAKTLLNFMEQLGDSEITLQEEMDAWGIDTDAFREMMETVSLRTFQQIPFMGPRQALGTMFYLAFSLGVKCAHENAMRMMVDND